MKFAIPLVLTVLTAAALPLSAADPLRGKEVYEKQIFPVLQEYCYDCHGDGADKGDFAMDKVTDYAPLLADRKLWDHVREQMSTHVMPPENKDQPTNEQRAAVLKWIDDNVFWFDPEKPDPGHVTLRRLNRVEYNNTVRDVFFVNNAPAKAFPPDDTGYGYDNIGDVLSLSPLLMEKYMKAARLIGEQAVSIRNAPRSENERSGDQFRVVEGEGRRKDNVMVLFSNGEMRTKITVIQDGPHRVSLMLAAMQAGQENARYAVLINDKEVKTGEIKEHYVMDKPWAGWERITFETPLVKGDYTLAVRFLNDASDEAATDPTRKDRNLLVQGGNVEGPIKFRDAVPSRFLRWLFESKELSPRQLVLYGSDFDHAEGGPIIFEERAYFLAGGSVAREFSVPEDGEYTIKFQATADQAGKENAKLSAKLDGTDLGQMEITAATGKQQWFSFAKKLTAGQHKLSVAFLNDFYQAEGNQDRNASVERVIIEGPVSKVDHIYGEENSRAWLSRLGLKTYRRPLDKEELDGFAALVEMSRQDGADGLEAVALVCEAMLCSPKFLYRGGAQPAGTVKNGAVNVDEYTLASRLSYFIWSSPPDDELLRLAGEGKLRENLTAQVSRMIGDSKGWALTSDFAGQWLRLRDIELANPNGRQFRDFRERGLASDMRKESELFFDHILRDNRSVLEFLDSNYTFANGNLAEFYGIKGVDGKQFRKVSLEGTPRGGLLTQAGILTITSHPTRTSPVKRGQFLLENILGTPPPPAPQNVPAFEEDRSAKVEGTLRQRFEAHRSNPSCASCHAFLDPFGFAFENYDPIGRWREQDNKQAIDASGKLLTGQQFKDAAELRKLLVELKKNDFTKSMVENLLIYSLGRGLDYSDRMFLKQMTERAEKNGYKFQDIILSVVESVPFQKMRADPTKKIADN